MTNRQVIDNFLNKRNGHTPKRIINALYMYEGMTLQSNGIDLINYNTRIAFHKENKVYLNIKKYSITTSKIQSLVKYMAIQNNLQVIEIDGEGY